MTEVTESSLHGTEVPEEEPVVPEAGNQKPAEETPLGIAQDNKPIQPETSEIKPKLEQEDGQGDGQKTCPPTEDTSSTELQWEVGAPCRAVWSEDGKVYPATVVAVDEERCRVRFSHYETEEDVEMSTLLSPDAQIQSSQLQDWKPGSRCRAVYSADGLFYPAVILWIKGQRCCVRYDKYNNEEEQDISKLLSHNELHGPSRATMAAAARGNSWKSGLINNTDRRRRRREEYQGDRGDERRSTSRDDHISSMMKDKPQNQEEKEADEKKSEEPTNNSVPLFPSFPFPPQMGLGNHLPVFSPPPLPPCVFSGKDAGVSPDINNMLLLWYLCGFHTGCYVMQQQLKSSPKDDVKTQR